MGDGPDLNVSNLKDLLYGKPFIVAAQRVSNDSIGDTHQALYEMRLVTTFGPHTISERPGGLYLQVMQQNSGDPKLEILVQGQDGGAIYSAQTRISAKRLPCLLELLASNRIYVKQTIGTVHVNGLEEICYARIAGVGVTSDCEFTTGGAELSFDKPKEGTSYTSRRIPLTAQKKEIRPLPGTTREVVSPPVTPAYSLEEIHRVLGDRILPMTRIDEIAGAKPGNVRWQVKQGKLKAVGDGEFSARVASYACLLLEPTSGILGKNDKLRRIMEWGNAQKENGTELEGNVTQKHEDTALASMRGAHHMVQKRPLPSHARARDGVYPIIGDRVLPLTDLVEVAGADYMAIYTLIRRGHLEDVNPSGKKSVRVADYAERLSASNCRIAGKTEQLERIIVWARKQEETGAERKQAQNANAPQKKRPETEPVGSTSPIRNSEAIEIAIRGWDISNRDAYAVISSIASPLTERSVLAAMGATDYKRKRSS